MWARHTARQSGRDTLIALNLLTGFVWLAASGILLVIFGRVSAGPAYDAGLHTLLLVLSLDDFAMAPSSCAVWERR